VAAEPGSFTWLVAQSAADHVVTAVRVLARNPDKSTAEQSAGPAAPGSAAPPGAG